jgi:hypothetical protein
MSVLHLTRRSQLSTVDCNRTVCIPLHLLEERRAFEGMAEVDKYRKQLRRLDESTRITRR